MNNRLWVDIYKDTASRFGICEDDGTDPNICQILVPASLLRLFYEKVIVPDLDEIISFDRWFYEEYTCDDVEDLLGFLVEMNYDLSKLNAQIVKEIRPWEVLMMT